MRKLKMNGDEYDAIYKVPLCVFRKPQIRSKTKRRYRRRERLAAKQEIRRLLKD